jgi:hypothetical protein
MAKSNQLAKTVLISGGMQDDVSTYQQSDPSCAYIENGRFRKKDEIEKRLPDTQLTDTGLPTSGSPLLLAEQNDTLITMDNEGKLYTLDTSDPLNTDWFEKQTNIIPSQAEVSFQSAPEPGAVNFQALEVGDDSSVDNYRMMAWEVRKPGAAAGFVAPLTEVVCELRRKDGSLLDRQRFPGGRHPRVVAQGSGDVPTLFYQKDSGLIVSHLVVSDALGPEVSTTIIAELEHPEVAGYVANVLGIVDRDDMRIGWCEDGGLGGIWDVASDGLVSAIVWKIGTLTRLQRLILSVPTGSPVTIATDAGTTVHTPLCIDVEEATEEAGMLVSSTDTATGAGDVSYIEYDISTATPTVTENFALGVSSYVGDLPRVVNGSLKSEAATGRWYYAVTVCGGDPDWLGSTSAPVQSSSPEVLAGRIRTDINAFDVNCKLMDHRLASQVTMSTLSPGFGTGADLVFAVEQWAPFAQPRSNNTDDEFMSCPVVIKPSTTIVIQLPPDSTEYKVIATLGAGQNKSFNGSAADQGTQLQSAYTIGDTPYIVTRTVLQPEDISVHGGAASATRKRVHVLFPGEAQGKAVALQTATTVRTRKYGNATLFSLAVPCQYDGVAFGEQSVFDQPEITTVDCTEPGSSYLDIAYEKTTNPPEPEKWDRYSVVVGFADHLGQLHRSAPSTPLYVSGHSPENTSAQQIQVTLGFTMPLSAYRGDRDYFVEVYQAEDEAAQHLAATKPISVINGATDDNTITFVKNVHTNSGENEPIRYSEVLYTEGDVLPSDPWPSVDDFVITSNRLFAISSEVPGTVYYSKLLEENIAPEFSAPLVISLGRNRDLTGIGAIDDKIVVFTDREIFAIYDTGPDNTGANGDFVIDRLQSTVGCSDAESIVEVPDGLFFYSGISQEFHLLSRDLQVHDIGKPIEDTAGSLTDIKAAVVVPSENEIRWFVTSDSQSEFGDPRATDPIGPPRARLTNPLPLGPVLVYNYYYKKWSVNSNQDGLHAVLFQNQPTYIESDWDVFQASLTAWAEDTTNLLKIRLPWVRVNQLQSYGRIDELTFLGKYLSSWRDDSGSGREAGDVQLTLNYDYEEDSSSPSDVIRYRANKGDLGTNRMQFSATPGRQKCQAIQVELEEVATTAVEVTEPTYATGRGWVISGMDIIYSPKQGTGSKNSPQRSSK